MDEDHSVDCLYVHQEVHFQDTRLRSCDVI